MGAETNKSVLYGMESGTGCTERVRRLNAQLRKKKPGVDLHRARVFTKIYKEHEAMDPISKKALALSETLETIEPKYSDGELIVGLSCAKEKSHPLHPEVESNWIMEEGGAAALATREYCPYQISAEEQKEFEEEIYPYWADKTITAKWRASCPEDIRKAISGTGFGEPSFMLSVYGSHMTPDWPEILTKGTNYYVEYAQKKLEELDPNDMTNMKRIIFYKSVVQVFRSVEKFAHNWADYLRGLAEKETDAAKKEELEKIAGICDRVPMEPARSFHEALQAIWFIFCVITNDGTGPLIYFGRPDQYLWELYRHDIDHGIMTQDEAKELLECLFIKSNNTLFFIDIETAHFFAGNSVFQNLMVGGTDHMGNDASNELSYLIIDAFIELRVVQPAMVVRMDDNTPEKFRNKVLELVKTGMGYPSIYNDKVSRQTMLRSGFDYDDANDYFCGGCMEIQKPAYWWWGPGQMINMGMGVDLALHNGVKQKTAGNMQGEQIGIATGDPRTFETFEAFENAVKAQVKCQLDYDYISAQHIVNAYQDYPLIINSVVHHSGLERGLPFHSGGCYGSACPGYVIHGIPDVGNSLAAVKKLVYDDKAITMDQLIQAVDADFAGFDDIYQMCMAAPKFGNDDDYVDMIEQEFFAWFADEVKSQPGILSFYDPDQETARIRHQRGAALVPLSGAIPQGATVGALPSGRKSGEPLGDSVAAYPGTDTNGPTAALKSVGKIDFARMHGEITNIYINREVMDTAAGRTRVNNLIRAAFDNGVAQLQFNVMDKEVYKDAQKHPEKYPSLLVRVTGYSAYFVDLDRELQDYILVRTQHAC